MDEQRTDETEDGVDTGVPHAGPFLMWGMGLLVAGVAILIYTYLYADTWDYVSSYDGSSENALLWIGWMTVLAGATFFPIGVYRVTSQLDAIYREVRERRGLADALVDTAAEPDPS